MTDRKEIARYGPKGRTVRVFVEAGGELVRIQWREAGALKTKSYPNTRTGVTEAKAWAKGFADTRDAVGPAPRITNRELWTAYTGSVEFRALRTNSVRLYGEAWRRWELMWGASFTAEQTTPAMADTFVSALEKRGLEISTVGHTIRLVRRVFGWGEGRGLLNRNRLASWRYKVSKDRRRQHQERKPGEFRSDDWAKIVAQLSPLEATQWRAWVALTVCGTQGARQHAVLHLRWEDVDFTAGRITWRAAFDKMGRALDAASGELTSNGGRPQVAARNASIGYGGSESGPDARLYGDAGGASRFFYTAKASRSERDAGLEHLASRSGGSLNLRNDAHAHRTGNAGAPRANGHPTVKPLDLMQWLCRLVTPKGGVVLDPFCGSGTTGRAAVAEGFSFIGIERDAEYADIARARIREYAPLFAGEA